MSRSCGPKLFWAWLLMPMRSLWYSKPSGRWCGNCTRTGSETAPRQRKLWSYCKSRSNNVRDLNEKWLPWCHHEHKKRPIDRTLSRYTFVWGNFFGFWDLLQGAPVWLSLLTLSHGWSNCWQPLEAPLVWPIIGPRLLLQSTAYLSFQYHTWYSAQRVVTQNSLGELFHNCVHRHSPQIWALQSCALQLVGEDSACAGRPQRSTKAAQWGGIWWQHWIQLMVRPSPSQYWNLIIVRSWKGLLILRSWLPMT